MELIISLVIGISLSATSGFRVFVPLLVLSIAAQAGWIELSPSFAWLAGYPALVALAVATFVEALAYFFPYLDNLLGAAAVPISVLAGTLITAALIVDLHPMLAWALAIIAGGGAALGGSAISNTAHAGSTLTTGGSLNPVLSLLESFFSLLVSLLAVLVPFMAFLVILIMAYLVVKLFLRRKRQYA